MQKSTLRKMKDTLFVTLFFICSVLLTGFISAITVFGIDWIMPLSVEATILARYILWVVLFYCFAYGMMHKW